MGPEYNTTNAPRKDEFESSGGAREVGPGRTSGSGKGGGREEKKEAKALNGRAPWQVSWTEFKLKGPSICSQAGKCEADMIGIHPAEASFLEKQVACSLVAGRLRLASATMSFGLPATVSRLF